MPQQNPLVTRVAAFNRGGVRVWTELSCDSYSGALRVIPYWAVQRVRWTKVPIYEETYPSVDPINAKIPHREYIFRPAIPLPSLPEDEPKPLREREVDYGRRAALMLARGETRSYPALGAFDWLEVPTLNDIVEREPDLPAVAVPPDAPPTATYQHVVKVSPQGDRGRIR